MEVLLIIIVVLFLFYKMIPWLIGRWLKNVQKRYQNAGAGPRANQRPEGSTSWQKPPQSKKRVDATEGDYVDYEEIKE